MTLDTRIHDKQFAYICLPMTHDTGTWDLTDELIDPPDWLIKLEHFVAVIVEELIGLGALPPGSHPGGVAYAEGIAATKGLATTTYRDVGTQLSMGIRGFDFRIFRAADGTYYTHHALRSGTTFNAMLDDIARFLGSTTGEIVYVNMSHYEGFAGSSDYNAFGNLVKSRLGAWAYTRESDNANDPFQKTYRQIIGQDGRNRSRCILVSQHDLGDSTYFWPKEYCPPVDTRNQSVLVGQYYNGSVLEDMIPAQVANFQDALAKNLPFANYMTLTPTLAEAVNIVVGSLYGALKVLSDEFEKTGRQELADAVEALALLLEAYHLATELGGFTTLEQLAQRVNKQLPEIIDDNFVPLTGDTNKISMIFCDFWETTQLVDVCIDLSNDSERLWTGNNPITRNSGTDQLGSDEGPTAAMFRGTLYMVYKDLYNTDLWMASYDPATKLWVSNQKIKEMTGGSFAPQTEKSPCVAVMGDVLYLVWAKPDKTLCWATWDGMAWSGGNAIVISDITAATDGSPYLAAYGDYLVMAHKRNGGNEIYWEKFSNGSWSVGQPIIIGAEYPKTNARPALCEYDGLLYMLFKGESENIWQCTFDGTTWSGNVEIKNSDEGYDPKSSEGPALARYGGVLYMIYKGKTDSVWMSTFNGYAWGGNLEMKSDTVGITPRTDRNPWAVRVELSLFLLNQGDDDKLYQSALVPVHF